MLRDPNVVFPILAGLFFLGLLMMGLSVVLKARRLGRATCGKCSRPMKRLSWAAAQADERFDPYFSSNVSFLKALRFFKCEGCESIGVQ